MTTTAGRSAGEQSAPGPADIAERVRTFLRLLEQGDIDSWIELWAEDADHHYPYGTEMLPAHLTGKPAIHELWTNAIGMFDVLSFPIREIFTDGATAIARFDSDSVLKSGKPYLNTYVCVFTFDEQGRLREYWEYFDPIAAGLAFGLLEVRYLEPS